MARGANTRRCKALRWQAQALRTEIVAAYRREIAAGRERGARARIAADFGVSRKTVTVHLQAAEISHRETIVTETAAARVILLDNIRKSRQRLDRVEQTIWDNAGVSKRPLEQLVMAEVDSKGRKIHRTITQRARTVGADGKPADDMLTADIISPALVAQLVQLEKARLELDKREAALLGCDAPTKIELTQDQARSELAQALGLSIDDLATHDARPDTVH